MGIYILYRRHWKFRRYELQSVRMLQESDLIASEDTRNTQSY